MYQEAKATFYMRGRIVRRTQTARRSIDGELFVHPLLDVI
jgi:hypothetical protein